MHSENQAYTNRIQIKFTHLNALSAFAFANMSTIRSGLGRSVFSGQTVNLNLPAKTAGYECSTQAGLVLSTLHKHYGHVGEKRLVCHYVSFCVEGNNTTSPNRKRLYEICNECSHISPHIRVRVCWSRT